MSTLIIIPAFNEAPVIATTITHIKKHLNGHLNSAILVIDDGSTDDTYQMARTAGVFVLRHFLNRGLGGALGTGLAYARDHHYDFAVTLDADGQHDPEDINRVLQPLITSQADVVIGSRTLSHQGKLPLDRKIIIMLSNLLTELLFNQPTTDSLSGFRGFNRRALESIVIKTDRMKVSNDFFSEIKRLGLKLAEVPIKIIYTDYSRSKGQSHTNSLIIIYKLLLRLFR